MISALLVVLLLNATPEERIRRLEQMLIAPCCWNESLATHRSETALKMKVELARLVREGRSDRQILDYYKERYGARILMEPEGTSWWVALIVPVAFAALALWFVLYWLRRLARKPGADGTVPALR